MNKKKFIIVSSSISVLIFSFLWFIPIIQYNINNKKSLLLNNNFKIFLKQKHEKKKLNRFKSLTDEYQTYQRDKGTNGKLAETYSNTLSEMKQYFTDNNQIVLKR